MAALSSSVSPSVLSLFVSDPHSSRKFPRKYSISATSSSSSAGSFRESQSTTKTDNSGVSAKGSPPNGPVVEPPEFSYSYAPANPNGSSVVRFVQSTESNIERVCELMFCCVFAFEFLYRRRDDRSLNFRAHMVIRFSRYRIRCLRF